jgi:hypothetical protein
MTDAADNGFAGFDLACVIKQEMTDVEGAAGFDLAAVINKTMVAHTARKGCRWIDGAEDAIIASPEFDALAQLIERYEICQAKAA